MSTKKSLPKVVLIFGTETRNNDKPFASIIQWGFVLCNSINYRLSESVNTHKALIYPDHNYKVDPIAMKVQNIAMKTLNDTRKAGTCKLCQVLV